MIEKEDYGISGCYLSAANFVVSIDKNYALELYYKAEETAKDFSEYNEISIDLIGREGDLANHLDDKENALRIVHQKCIPLVDKIPPYLTTKAMQQSDRAGKSQSVVQLLIDLSEIQGPLWELVNDVNQTIGILDNYRKKNNL